MTSQSSAAVAPRIRRTKTWSRFGQLGRKPSEYEIVTHDMNHTVGAIPLEMGPEVHGNLWLARHRDGIALKVGKLEAFRDPDRLTYRTYTQSMDEQETYVDGLLRHFGDVEQTDKNLSPAALDLLANVLAPTRYLGHGLQMMSAYVQQLAHSSYIANCAAFQTADQLRRVQRVAYRTRQLANAYPTRGFGVHERKIWEGVPDWQPTRMAIEQLLLAYDWDQAFVGLNLVVKPVVDEIFLKAFANVAREHDDELDALIAENLFLDAQRSRRWTVEACSVIARADADNSKVLLERLESWRSHGENIIDSASRLLARDALGNTAPTIAKDCRKGWSDFLAQAGLGGGT